MTIIQGIRKILKKEAKIVDIWHYILGSYRYKIFYGKRFCFLVRRHIYEQITYRIEWMDRECLDNGSCKICGCETTALQMANKPCDKPCYPKMMNRKQWKRFKKGSSIKDKNGVWVQRDVDKKPLLFKETIHSYVPLN